MDVVREAEEGDKGNDGCPYQHRHGCFFCPMRSSEAVAFTLICVLLKRN